MDVVTRTLKGWEPICKFLGKPVPDQPFPHENRLGSVIDELANDPHYQATMKRQYIGWINRIIMIVGKFFGANGAILKKILGAVYLYKNPALLPACMQEGRWAFSLTENLWPTLGYLASFFFLFNRV